MQPQLGTDPREPRAACYSRLMMAALIQRLCCCAGQRLLHRQLSNHIHHCGTHISLHHTQCTHEPKSAPHLVQLLRRRIEQECSLDLIGAGLVITGGTSQLRGLRSIAETIFDLPTRLASAQDVTGPTSAYQNPSLSTAIGLVKYAQAVSADYEEDSLFGKLTGLFRRK